MSRITRLPQKEIRTYQAKTLFTKDLMQPFNENKTLNEELEERLEFIGVNSTDEELFSYLSKASDIIIEVLNLDKELYVDSTIVPTNLTRGKVVTFVEYDKLVYNEGELVKFLTFDDVPIFIVLGNKASES